VKTLRPGAVMPLDMDSRSWAAWNRDQSLEDGTYTPTLSNVTNVSASTAFECQYARVGNAVNVSGKASVTATGAGTIDLGISLPIASAIAAAEDVAGVGTTTSFLAAYVAGDSTNDRAQLSYSAPGAGTLTVYFNFTYWVQ
jgi:hypothetical protein